MLAPLSPVSMLATPSMVMLLEFGRCPFAENWLALVGGPAATPPPAIAPGTTPGTMPISPKKLRPLTAMF